ncbi:SIMPL domain-containing protein [Ferrimonas balearica]|uniref:SIMPL domain-containing protein n=1 Tax=Ferrimonas balearica TaxID=44012 RepID=UPI001C99F807|nr:SIMPL domain-containing protein [Ferrimonas balearica]MBY5993951.1 SIMPL domain-containing protein [Ferrimonas balearica]
MASLKTWTCLLLLLPSLAMAEGRWIEVEGLGSLEVAPDRARLTGQITALAKSPDEAKAEVDEVVDRVLDALDEAELSPSQYGAGSLTLGPRYDYQERQRRLLGYEARRSVTLEVEVAEVATWLARFTELGLNELSSPGYFASDDLERRRDLFRLALEDALDKADALAQRLDSELGEVLTITEQGATPMPRQMAMAEAADSGRYQPARQAQQVRLLVRVALD